MKKPIRTCTHCGYQFGVSNARKYCPECGKVWHSNAMQKADEILKYLGKKGTWRKNKSVKSIVKKYL